MGRVVPAKSPASWKTWCRSQGRPDWYEIFKSHYFPAAGAATPCQDAIAEACRCSAATRLPLASRADREQFAQLFRQAVAA